MNTIIGYVIYFINHDRKPVYTTIYEIEEQANIAVKSLNFRSGLKGEKQNWAYIPVCEYVGEPILPLSEGK